jgi:hypothetical protein
VSYETGCQVYRNHSGGKERSARATIRVIVSNDSDSGCSVIRIAESWFNELIHGYKGP